MSEPVHTSETPAPEQAAQPAESAKPDESQDTTDWKAEARKWETRAKENKAKADDFEKARKAAMTEAERAVVEAEERGRMSAVTAYGERLARTEFMVEAARRNGEFDVSSLFEDDLVNLKRLIGEDGEPDSKAIAKAVARLVPEGATGPTPPPSFDGGTRQPATSGGSMTDLIRKATGRA